MNFETAADAFIRPTVGSSATPAHSAAAGAVPGAAPGAAVGAASAQQAAWQSEGATGERGAKAEHETAAGELSFYDLLDVINPLQHIPGVASVYRAMTGDEIKAPAQILGGMLFGGGIGLVAAAANAVVKESSGRDIGEAVLASLFGDEAAPANLATAAPDAEEAALAAELQPAAGPAAAPLAAGAQAAMPAEQGTDQAAADAVAQAMGEPTDPSLTGPSLSGRAALNAFLNDLATVGRNAQGVTETAAEEVAETVAVREPAAAQTAAEAHSSHKQGNLIGLGSRDKRPSAHKAPAVVVPAARLVGVAQPAAAQEAEKSAPRIVSGAAPRLSGAATVDPTLFATETGGEANTLPASAPAADSAVPSDFSEQMMRALQKYETLLDDRPAAGDPS